MTGDEAHADTERSAAHGGPRTLVVVVGMLAAAALFAGAVVGWTAWRDRSRDDADAAAATVPTTEPGDGVAADAAELLFRRTTATGIEIRAESMATAGLDAEMMWMPVDDGAPAHCQQVDQINAVALDGSTVVLTSLPVTKGLDGEVSPMMMYGSVGRGIVGVAIQVEPAVTLVTLVAPDGTRDEMAPIDGVAVVAVHADIDAAAAMFGGELPDGSTLTVSTADGRSRRVDDDDLMQGPRVWNDERCFGGGGVVVGEDIAETTLVPEDMFAVELPPPGATQPADPAAARAAIVATFDAFYGTSRDDVLALVDDPFAMREMIDELGEGVQRRRFDRAEVELEELVFLSAVEAAFDYSLETANDSHDELFGRARLVGDRWVLTRGTACQGLEFFEVFCPS